MRSLYESLLDDEDELLDDGPLEIFEWLKDNYIWYGGGSQPRDFKSLNFKKVGKKYIVSLSTDCGHMSLTNKELKTITNGKFEFGEMFMFKCSDSSIESLDGAPKQAVYFYAENCKIKDLYLDKSHTHENVKITENNHLKSVNLDCNCNTVFADNCPQLTEIKINNLGKASLRNYNANSRGLTVPKCKSLKTIYIDGVYNELYIDCNTCKSLTSIYSSCGVRYIDCHRCSKLEKLDFEFADIITSIYADSCVNLKQLPSVANKAIQGAFKIRNCENIALTIDDLPRAMTSTVTRGVLDLRGTACKLYAWEIFKKVSHISPKNIKIDHDPSILTDKK